MGDKTRILIRAMVEGLLMAGREFIVVKKKINLVQLREALADEESSVEQFLEAKILDKPRLEVED